MELSRLLVELKSYKRWLIVGGVISFLAAVSTIASISFFPPSVKSKSVVFSSATSQMIVDSPQSSLGDLQSDLSPLTARAGIFARFMTSSEALNYIGQAAGIPGSEIEAEGPFEIGMPASVHTPSKLKDGKVVPAATKYRLRFDQNPDLPIVDIFARAPTTQEATRLADGAVTGLARYLNDLEAREGIAATRRVDIRQLGNATGGVVNPGANKKVAFLVFVIVFLLWCGLVLFAGRVRAGLRLTPNGATPRARPEPTHPTPNGDGPIILPHVVDRGG